MFRKGLFALCILILLLAVPASAFASGSSLNAGAVYLMTNATSGNQVIAYYRNSDGTLTQNGVYDTGGLGSGIGTATPPDPLGSQNSLLLSGSWLFAVNAGSNQVSVFRVREHSLQLTDTVSSKGVYPDSLTFKGRTLYVLNAGGDGNITGFSLSREGKLTVIPGSSRSLDAATPNVGNQPDDHESPAEVGFTPDGKFLVVTDKGGISGVGRVLVFPLKDKLPSANFTATITTGPVPFAFTFDPFGHLVVVELSMGSVTAYSIAANGSLTTLGSALTNQAASCWIVSVRRYLFVDNTGSGSISAFNATESGTLTNLNGSGAAAVTGAGTLPIDIGASGNGHYEYSFESGAGAIGIYHIHSDGSLSFVGLQGGLPAVGGYEGMAVR
jgi:6-phosphogluconolactonase (cycloisomerase 2 family)